MKKAILAAILFTSVTAQAGSYESVVLRDRLCHRQGNLAAAIYAGRQSGISKAYVVAKAAGDKVTEVVALRMARDVYSGKYDSEREAYQLEWARCMDENPVN